MKTTLLILAGATVVGYFMADNLKGYQPFTMAYAQGAKLAAK